MCWEWDDRDRYIPSSISWSNKTSDELDQFWHWRDGCFLIPWNLENLCQQQNRISQRWEWTLCLSGCLSLLEICRGIVCRTTRQMGGAIETWLWGWSWPWNTRISTVFFVNVFRIIFPFGHGPIGPRPILHTYARTLNKWLHSRKLTWIPKMMVWKR